MKVLMTILGLILAAAAYVPSAHADEDSFHSQLCFGEYYGQYSNGVQAVADLRGDWIELRLNGFIFKGQLECHGRYREAHLRFWANSPALPGEVVGEGTISFERDGRAHIGFSQNNGLLFSGVR